jgi:hypothetical protein
MDSEIVIDYLVLGDTGKPKAQFVFLTILDDVLHR